MFGNKRIISNELQMLHLFKLDRLIRFLFKYIIVSLYQFRELLKQSTRICQEKKKPQWKKSIKNIAFINKTDKSNKEHNLDFSKTEKFTVQVLISLNHSQGIICVIKSGIERKKCSKFKILIFKLSHRSVQLLLK